MKNRFLLTISCLLIILLVCAFNFHKPSAQAAKTSNLTLAETKTFNFAVGDNDYSIEVTKQLSDGNLVYKPSQDTSLYDTFTLSNDRFVLNLYSEANAVIIDFKNGTVSKLFSGQVSDDIQVLYRITLAEVLEVLPDREHIVYYTTRNGSFELYLLDVNSGSEILLPSEIYKDILAWIDSSTAIIAQGMSDYQNDEYVLIKYNFATNEQRIIKKINCQQLDSLTLNNKGFEI